MPAIPVLGAQKNQDGVVINKANSADDPIDLIKRVESQKQEQKKKRGADLSETRSPVSTPKVRIAE